MNLSLPDNPLPRALGLSVDKFKFIVATDRLYTDEGVWAQADGPYVRLGLSDFLQQRSGDVAFAEVRPLGTELAVDDEFAVIETIKVDISLTSPISGRIVETNPAMTTAPETINQDPYGKGWLALVEPDDWERDRAHLLSPEAYLECMRRQAEETSKE